RRAIDLVREQHVREDRTGDELELLLVLIEDRDADDVRRQQITRALNALELKRERAGDRMGQRRLPHAGHILEQDVALRQQRRDRELHDLRLAAYDLLDVRLERNDAVERAIQRNCLSGHRYLGRSTTRNVPSVPLKNRRAGR